VPVELLCIAPRKSAPPATPDVVSVVAGAGIAGDRHFGGQQKPAGRNVTLVEAEEIERFCARNGVQLALTATRRNIVTRDVRLNELVGKDFSIGSVTLRGVELCEPCSKLARYLSHTQLSPPQIVRSLAHRAGLRADVLTSGTIARGDPVVMLGVVQECLL
jgi:MOSC domain-containing protein YiiM